MRRVLTAGSAVRAAQWPKGYSEVAGSYTNSDDSSVAQLFLAAWESNVSINAYLINGDRTQGAVAIDYVSASSKYFVSFLLVSV